ncbi:hypothetical protein FPQ10_10240 [Allobacillus sp. SKP2-8]|uniref:hypothetical protein n=1 Tax=unclassified Allobacillus TaxID=2628859 RepID=UPI0011835B10|nr:hypothetical protein [Allobacillus sp. SKP2-8]TSJ65125.1 hypothetical protein FPQ10_10240 [Allobacillus sp. SKP2-8]
MFLDLLNTLFIDATVFYLYLGILLIVVGAIYVSHLYNQHLSNSDYLFTNQHQSTKVNINPFEKPIITNESFIVWLIMTFKRIDEKDDKADDNSSYFKQIFKIRGGQEWNKTAYSLSSESILF